MALSDNETCTTENCVPIGTFCRKFGLFVIEISKVEDGRFLHKFYMFYLLKTTAAISLREFWLEMPKNVDQRMETRRRFLNLSSFVSGYQKEIELTQVERFQETTCRQYPAS